MSKAIEIVCPHGDCRRLIRLTVKKDRTLEAEAVPELALTPESEADPFDVEDLFDGDDDSQTDKD